ncbi:MAG: A/G-specific adenine glycosylase [Sporomusaceae bacterium]|nr:A/G-specific adenine glycosylase [Sporomusaceae bacterium]
MELAKALLTWYKAEKRDLPWRRDQDPYKIWVSEIMLQQTRVEAVIPYFERFLSRFPTIESLAVAPEEEVLQYWQGLGYYSRARNLHKGVREVAVAYGGKIPVCPTEIKKLAGVGDYTAGAIASIAFQVDCPAVDGNVMRVFSRLFAVAEDISTTAVKRKITKLVHDQLPQGEAGDFNQALMDLGAAVCIPGNPRCQFCPLTAYCEAFKLERTKELPIKRPKKQPRSVYVTASVIVYKEKYLVIQRPKTGLLAGMWQFPAQELERPQVLAENASFWETQGIQFETGEFLCALTHTFSHIRWYLEVYCYSAKVIPKELAANSPVKRWLTCSELKDITWAGPYGKIAAMILERNSPTA